jgi:uncharacterized membrane protein
MLITYKIVFLATALLLALIAGLFYSYSCSVNPGLGRLTDMEYLRAMQSINRAILNPVFFASFVGTFLLLPVSTWLCWKQTGADTTFYLILAAAIIYILGVFGVTMGGNVPLNNMLDKADLTNATTEGLKTLRGSFEGRWNMLHTVRTVCNVVSLALFLAAFIKR